jgi:DNA invertase Pin-like site-specific DNA recombinase
VPFKKQLYFDRRAPISAVQHRGDFMKRVAIYSRVTTERQTVANQVCELRAWAERCGHTVFAEYEDHAISGAKGRDQRPAFDRMLKGAVRREFDIIAVWSSDRLGRSLPHLIEVLQTIRDTRAGLYIHTQALDTTTPAGRAMFGMLVVFAEFEREMIIARVNAGLDRARRDGKRLGRPKLAARVRDAAIQALQQGSSVRQAAALSGASIGTIAALRKKTLGQEQVTRLRP